MKWKRIVRSALALVLVCCLIFNLTPITAHALSLTASTLLGIGLVATLICGTMGIVLAPTSGADYVAIGQSLSDHMYAATKKPDSKITDIQVGIWLEDVGVAMSGGKPSSPGDKLSTSAWNVFITAEFMRWAKSFVDGNRVTVEDTSTDGLNYALAGTHIPRPVSGASTCSKDFYWAKVRYLKDGALTLAHVFMVPNEKFTFSEYIGWSSISELSTTVGDVKYWFAVIEFTSFDESDLAGSVFYADKLWYTNSDLPAALLTGACTDYIAPSVDTVILDDIYFDDDFVEIGATIPDIQYGNIVSEGQTLEEAVTQIQTELAQGNLTLQQYLEQLTNGSTVSTVVQDPTQVGGTSWSKFTSWLSDALWNPIHWLGAKLDALGQLLSDIKSGVISIPEALSQLWSAIIVQPITTLLEAIAQPLTAIWDWCVSLPDTLSGLFTSVIVEPLLAGLSYLFIPSEGFLSDRVDALRVKFGFADGVIGALEVLVAMFNDLDPEPPVIWIDLGASRGSFDIGGKVKFVDMTWYAEYKPTVDQILSAFLWLWFVWRLALSLPGIISGTTGIWGDPNTNVDWPLAPLPSFREELPPIGGTTPRYPDSVERLRNAPFKRTVTGYKSSGRFTRKNDN